jgi:hypothetical protein
MQLVTYNWFQGNLLALHVSVFSHFQGLYNIHSEAVGFTNSCNVVILQLRV